MSDSTPQPAKIPKASGFLDDLTAPTPQNTPATHATPSALSRPQVPSTIPEDGDDDEEEDSIPATASASVARGGGRGAAAAAAGLGGANGLTRQAILNNPAFASMVQSRLSSLVGRSSGYIDQLPTAVRSRLTALKGLQAEQTSIEADLKREIYELEKKYLAKYQPIWNRRNEIVNGGSEPNEKEIELGQKEERDEWDEEHDSDEGAVIEEVDVDEITKGVGRMATKDEIAQGPNGVPEFWLTALKNHIGIADLISERDEECLKLLQDVKVEYLDESKPSTEDDEGGEAQKQLGFKLTFKFDEEKIGAWFSNEGGILTKTYLYEDDVGYDGDFQYERAVGTEIKWKDGKDLTVRVETKRQRNKNTGQIRLVKKMVPTDSFFNFFNPPNPDGLEDEDEEDEDLADKLDLDYQIGEDFKEKFIPRAIDYFTGKALRYDGEGTSGYDDWDDEDALDDDDDDDDDDDEDAAPRGKKKAKKAPQPPPTSVTPGSANEPQECRTQ